ncbi:MAG: hypothetical protein V7676_17885 [Parasphingorhabdus sp.]
MTPILIFAAIVSLSGGAIALYLSARHQALVANPPAQRFSAIFGILALVFALLMFLQFMGPATAVFTWV